MNTALAFSERSTCLRLKVGAVIIKDGMVVSSGYNGSISGQSHCTDEGCLMYENSCKRCIHAEHNAILQCAKRGVSTDGCELFVTHFPCAECMKAIAQSGIKKVYFRKYYAHKYENTFADSIELIKL